MRILALVMAGSLLCVACTPGQYALVPAGVTRIGDGRLQVSPGIPWNRVPSFEDQRRWQTVWTQNGPLLDLLSIVSGVPEEETIIRSYQDDPVQVPEFRSDLGAGDLAAMVRAAYQARGVTTFDFEAPVPAEFLGGDGFRFAFRYTPQDGAAHRGICTMRTVDKKFYAIILDAESTHYFGALLPEFEKLAASARLR